MASTKYVFSTKDTVRYRFPTHTNELVMDRSETETSEAFIVVLEPDEAPPLHVHDDAEQLFYIVQGQGVLQIGDQNPERFSVNPGDFVRIPCHALHLIRCEGPERLVYLSIDCFIGGRPADEPTWESHVLAVCRQFGWDLDQVRGKESGMVAAGSLPG